MKSSPMTWLGKNRGVSVYGGITMSSSLTAAKRCGHTTGIQAAELIDPIFMWVALSSLKMLSWLTEFTCRQNESRWRALLGHVLLNTM